MALCISKYTERRWDSDNEFGANGSSDIAHR